MSGWNRFPCRSESPDEHCHCCCDAAVDGEVTSSLVESTLASMAIRDPGEPNLARRLVAELAGDGWLDEVMAQSGDRGVELTGSGGFLPETDQGGPRAGAGRRADRASGL